MEGLAAAASVVGIVSLGIQLAQILQTQLDDIVDADERLVQLVTEIKGTAYSISQLRDFLQEEEDKSPNDRILIDQGRAEFISIIKRCDIVYRNCVTLIANAGTPALAAVDDFQRNLKRKDELKADYEVILDIEVSNLQHLMYPLRKSKIERCSADLDRLRLLLILMLSTASLAKSRARSISSSSSATLYSSDPDQLEEGRLVDKLFYTNKGYRTAEKSLAKITASGTSPDPVADRVANSFASSTSSDPEVNPETKRFESAVKVLHNWPYLGDGTSHIPSTLNVLELGIKLSAYALDFSSSQSRWHKIPSTMRSLHQQTLRYSKNDLSLADSFILLSLTGQRSISNFLDSIAEQPVPYGVRVSYPVLLSIQVRKQWLRRTMNILKSFSPYRKIEAFTPTVFVVIAQIAEPHSNSTSGHSISDSMPTMPDDGPPVPDSGPSIPDAVVRNRPTYIKVNKKYLKPETLNHFAIEWEFDDRDPDFIIIKQWIPEDDLDTLFEHTRKLQERKRMVERQKQPREEYDQPLKTKRPSNRSPLSRTMTSSHQRTHQRLITDYAHNVIEPDSEDEKPPTEADKIAVADYYLRKWTTVFEKVREKNHAENVKEDEEKLRKEDEDKPRKKDKENPSKEDEENPRPIRRVTIDEVKEG